MQENIPIIASVKPKRGRKIKHVVNSYGKYECTTCSKSYNNKQCLFQHTRLKHSNSPSAPLPANTVAVDDVHELLTMKSKTQEALLNLFRLFIERVGQRTDEYMSIIKSLCTETNITLGKVEYLSKLTI